MYKESSIDEIRNADIVRIVGNFLELKKVGSKYFAKSPFSEDKSASFCVTPSLNIFKCFSSGIGGDGIKFIQLHKNATYPEALKIIADICQIVMLEEEVSEEETRKRSYRQELFDITSLTVTKYQKELSSLPSDHWTKKIIAERNMSDEILTKFGIGYAPQNSQFLTAPYIDNAKLEVAKTVGLVNSKEGRSFDFFRDRLIFPIHDFRGNVIAFGGRKSNEAEGPKYINSKETEIYSKSNVLYGLFQSKQNIMADKTAVLVEGYTDVTGLYENGLPIAVASCGTALSEIQCKLLHRFASHVIICRDNDGLDANGNEQKGTLAALRDINILLAEGFKVSVMILPEGEDPDSFARKFDKFEVPKGEEKNTSDIKSKALKEYFFKNAEDAVNWKTLKLFRKAANDPDALSESVNEVAEMLFQIKDDIKQEACMKSCAHILGYKKSTKILKDKMASFIKKAESKTEVSGKAKAQDAEIMGLPEGADYSLYFELGFVPHKHNIYFRGREKFFRGTNYKITPLFFLRGQDDSKRLCEVISDTGKKKLIEFDTSDMVQMARFEGRLLDVDNFVFEPDVTPNHFKLLRNSLMNGFDIADELNYLGWHNEGFFAFSDGIFHKGIFKKANDYGIVQLETGIDHQSEYIENIQHFFSPAASVMHLYAKEGEDMYENDRFLVFKQSPITINEWMLQLVKCYGEKAITGIAFVFASLFRDMFITQKDFFPHLFLTGEKGSGKSKFGVSLHSFFSFKQPAFDLNSGSYVALSRRISRVKNVADMFEEYNDSQIDDKTFQMLKAAFGGIGREIGKATGDNRTKVTRSNSSMIILSQYLPSRDDNSLTTRSLLAHFTKPQESYTTEQVENLSILKSWEETGITSLMLDVLQHRDHIAENLKKTFSDVTIKMKQELKGRDYDSRMLDNYVALLVPYTLLEKQFMFPFKKDEIWKLFKEAIIDSSDLIVESEGLSEFWRTLEFLLDTGRIKSGYAFEIKKPLDVKLQKRKGEADEKKNFEGKKRILYLRLNAVHQLYHKEVSTRDGVDVIGENTLKNYFRSKKYFIGSVQSVRFEDTATSAYLFDYDMMEAQNILNLVRQPKEDDEGEEQHFL